MPPQLTSHLVKVAIIEDERDIRDGLATLLRLSGQYRCCGSYRSMEEALERIAADVPDIALVDIGLPGMNGIEGIRVLKQRHAQMRLLMLTVYARTSSSSMRCAPARAGIC